MQLEKRAVGSFEEGDRKVRHPIFLFRVTHSAYKIVCSLIFELNEIFGHFLVSKCLDSSVEVHTIK